MMENTDGTLALTTDNNDGTLAPDAVVDATVIPRTRRKADRAKRIPYPVTPEEKIIMYGEIVAKAKKVKETLEEKRAKVTALKEELLALPRIYVKNNRELKLIDELFGFEDELYVGVNVDEAMIKGFAEKHKTIKITRNVVVFR